ncbi:hydrogenase formation protein HypD, partial [candidate division WOR-3 bacterium]|nr:hydrogenase formation protein HypD [candidate division WOR-3 bacterium]
MKYFDEYQNPDIARKMIERICDLSGKIPGEIRLMEVCGTHTTAIGKTGIRKLIPEKVELLSGPGCPVCVTPNSYLCKAFHYSRTGDVIITTFGDMIKVPVMGNSLEREKSDGGHITIVYSAADSLKIAEENPQKKIIFLAVGFETTAPTVA